MRILAELQGVDIKNMRYLSPDVQNELIHIMGNQVLRNIVSNIRKGKHYCIMADETSDVSNKEQMCLVLRWVNLRVAKFMILV